MEEPNLDYKGNMASFNPRTKAQVSLMFHTGASIPGVYSRLEGGDETARYMKFTDLAKVESAANEIRSVVQAWCESRG
ncbi:MAG: hypothetical protein O6951_06370 [Actinobacteria bacterium]|nr:hypothetical protein [Actinomycetota bacterium]